MSLFLVLLLLVSLAVVSFAPTAATSKSNYPIAKPNCLDHCGNVSIPFPFGLTDECALNRGFFIDCNNATSTNGSPIPFLGHGGNVEVRRISVDGQMNVKSYVARRCYDKGEYTPRLNIFSFKSSSQSLILYVNQTGNKFVAVGCDIFGYVYGYGESGTYRVEGCNATCSNIGNIEEGSCSGLGCCETGIPNVARNVYVSVDSSNNNYSYITGVIPCNYVFVVQKEEFNFSTTLLTTRNWDLERETPLTMLLDWTISEQLCLTVCLGNTTCVLVNGTFNSEGYRCGCKEGYEGNPYLTGCQDIDECEVGEKNSCSKNSICTNTEGGYKCACEKGYEGNPYFQPGCLDINECENGQHNCSENFTCKNKPGNFSCHCKDGYKDDGKGGCQLPSIHGNNVHMIALGAALGTIMLLVICFSLYLAYRQRKSVQMRDKFFRDNGGMILQQRIAQGSTSSGTTRIFTAEELKKATSNYDQTRIIGQGGFGIVYKGHLLDGRIVAVKKAKMMDPTQVEQFINEVIVLSQINHKNIVKLFGCCLETEIPLLVYEFISNGTLSEHLHNKDMSSALSWSTRLRIATETAEVLSYLHSAASPPIIHRDVKSVNILLDDDYTARVSDFGASRLVPQDQTQLTTMVQGTFGYLDPEYLQTNHLTEKSDVYSFGVVLVELLTSRRALSFEGPEKERHLSQYFLSLLKENQPFKILDANIVSEENNDELQEVALLAKRCLNVKGEDRPTMKEVAVELSGLRRASKHPWTNNLGTSIESEALLTGQPIPFGYDATFSITTTEYDSLKHHMQFPAAAGR
ncbi:PREDICTED: wall-associated receptor kinase 2-like [Ipomoea nil]|uniref:wall-associated receptor kinase 2-like n=1 Tax=Ipomoea nil TaxID=35883 RepID=UPI0009017E99|nr:PREDICTED: wall-associated receptor kinase 2-like [Ipomoea nil]